jgi:hypothetical protein
LPPIHCFQICPPTREYPRVFTGSTDTGVPCHFPEALKHIEAKCHGQELCSMITAPEVFGATALPDPCPGYRKYVEVAFKCRPTQFRSKMTCNGEAMDLGCTGFDDNGKELRLAVYSAQFASADGSHIYCAVPQAEEDAGYYRDAAAAAAAAYDAEKSKYDVSEINKCEESNIAATESVVDMCHGKSK